MYFVVCFEEEHPGFPTFSFGLVLVLTSRWHHTPLHICEEFIHPGHHFTVTGLTLSTAKVFWFQSIISREDCTGQKTWWILHSSIRRLYGSCSNEKATDIWYQNGIHKNTDTEKNDNSHEKYSIRLNIHHTILAVGLSLVAHIDPLWLFSSCSNEFRCKNALSDISEICKKKKKKKKRNFKIIYKVLHYCLLWGQRGQSWSSKDYFWPSTPFLHWSQLAYISNWSLHRIDCSSSSFCHTCTQLK